MRISIITISYNSSRTIERAINSVLYQKNVDLEYILIDGKSTDNTVDIIKKYDEKVNNIKWISEPDKGIYDAMNKGIQMATGDIIGILNSDDFYASDDILETVCNVFLNNDIQCCYGNILYVKSVDKNIRPYRYWVSGRPRSFKFGWMPPHPAFFVKKEIYNKYGLFRLDCGTAADYEFMLRLYEKYKIKSMWINKIFTYMEAGGASSANLISYKKSHKYDIEAWDKNNLHKLFIMAWLKKIRKIPQFLYAKFVKIDF